MQAFQHATLVSCCCAEVSGQLSTFLQHAPSWNAACPACWCSQDKVLWSGVHTRWADIHRVHRPVVCCAGMHFQELGVPVGIPVGVPLAAGQTSRQMSTNYAHSECCRSQLAMSNCPSHVSKPPCLNPLQVILVRDLDARTRLPKELQHSNALIMTVAQAKGLVVVSQPVKGGVLLFLSTDMSGLSSQHEKLITFSCKTSGGFETLCAGMSSV